MRIIKFNESSSGIKPHEVALSELKLSIKDIELILYKLSKYSNYLSSDGKDLINDLELLKESNWTHTD